MLEGLEIWEKVIAITGGFLGIIGTIGGMGIAFYKYVLKPHLLVPIVLNTQMTSEALLLAKEISKEVRFNGGGTLKDGINKLAIQCINIEEQLLVMRINTASHKGLFNAIMTQIHLGHWRSGLNGQIQEAGTSMCRIMQRSESELVGFNWLSWVVVSDRERVRNEWMDAFKTGRNFDIDFCCEQPDRKRQRVRIVAFQVQEAETNNEKHFHGYIGTLSAIGKPYEDCPAPSK